MSETETPPDRIEICPECDLPLMTPKALPLNAGVDICPACGQTPLATTVLTIYGPDTNPEKLFGEGSRVLVGTGKAPDALGTGASVPDLRRSRGPCETIPVAQP